MFCNEQQFTSLYLGYILTGKIVLQGVESYIKIKPYSN